MCFISWAKRNRRRSEVDPLSLLRTLDRSLDNLDNEGSLLGLDEKVARVLGLDGLSGVKGREGGRSDRARRDRRRETNETNLRDVLEPIWEKKKQERVKWKLRRRDGVAMGLTTNPCKLRSCLGPCKNERGDRDASKKNDQSRSGARQESLDPTHFFCFPSKV